MESEYKPLKSSVLNKIGFTDQVWFPETFATKKGDPTKPIYDKKQGNTIKSSSLDKSQVNDLANDGLEPSGGLYLNLVFGADGSCPVNSVTEPCYKRALDAHLQDLDGPSAFSSGSPIDSNSYVNEAIPKLLNAGNAINDLCKDMRMVENGKVYKAVTITPNDVQYTEGAPSFAVTGNWIKNMDDNCGSTGDNCGYFRVGCEWTEDV